MRQRGQVMPMTLVFIAAVILSLWVMYDAGQVASEKMRLQNTADNVAYSTAALVSRDLNFIAYTNRAMVANQVGIAQMVGLSSYVAMLEQFAYNLDRVADALSAVGVGVFIKPYTAGLAEGATAASEGMDAAATAFSEINDQVIVGLSNAQQVVHTTYMTAIPAFTKEIAERNDPDVKALLSVGGYGFTDSATLIANWNRRIGGQYELHQDADGSDEALLANRRYREFEEIITHSRDPFSRERSYHWGRPFSGNAVLFKWQTRKYGGSDLFRRVGSDGKYKWNWAAEDNVSFYVKKCHFGLTGLECSDYDGFLPLGWGAAHELDHDSNGDFFDYGTYSGARRDRRLWGNGAWRNRSAARLLAYGSPFSGEDHTRNNLRDMNGLQPFYAFREDGGTNNYGPAVVALYVKEDRHIGSQRTIIEGTGGTVAERFDTESAGGLIQGRIGAVAKAQPYYMRPTDLAGWRRRDARYEFGNLYNPFWQPRLVALTNAEKAMATAIITGGEVMIDPGGGANP